MLVQLLVAGIVAPVRSAGLTQTEEPACFRFELPASMKNRLSRSDDMSRSWTRESGSRMAAGFSKTRSSTL